MSQAPRILIVEDDRAVAVLLDRTLSGQGFDVTVVADGLDGYAAVNTATYDVILLDHLLPGMLGSELLDRLKDDGITTPVIMLSGVTGEDEIVQALQRGAIDYIRKPFSLREVLARISVHTRRMSRG